MLVQERLEARRPGDWSVVKPMLPCAFAESIAVLRSSAERFAVTRSSALARIAVSSVDRPLSASRSDSPTMFQSNGSSSLASSVIARDRARRSAR